MPPHLEPLVLDLVAWCASTPRSYQEVLDAWRTSCPRLMVWEEAQANGLLETRTSATGLTVVVTEAGLRRVSAMLARRRSPEPPLAAWTRGLRELPPSFPS